MCRTVLARMIGRYDVLDDLLKDWPVEAKDLDLEHRLLIELGVWGGLRLALGPQGPGRGVVFLTVGTFLTLGV
jgi:hypothetical protein